MSILMTRKLIAEIENPDKQDRYIASMEDDDPTRPSIGFSLGLVLLFVVLLSMSGFLTCCLHWDKIRALLGALTHDQENDHLPQKSSPPSLKVEINQSQSLPVLMPGDEVPKFIAISCPCAHPIVERQEIPAKVKPVPVPVPRY